MTGMLLRCSNCGYETDRLVAGGICKPTVSLEWYDKNVKDKTDVKGKPLSDFYGPREN